MSTHSHSKRNAFASASGKFVLLSVLLVVLTFPHASHEFGFPFGGGSDGDDDSASKQVSAKKHKPVEKKFKFHKIERIEDDDDDNDEGNDNVGGNSNHNRDDDDDDDNNKRRESRRSAKAEADSSRTNEDEEYQFERAHKSHRERQQNPKQRKASKKDDRTAERRSSTREDSKRDDDDDDKDASSESFFGSLFGSLYGGSGEKHKDKSAEEQTNDIIDWLKWLGEKLGRSQPPPPPPPPTKESDDENWLSYFNRWPFNSLFPIGKPQKPIQMPRRSVARGATSKDDDDSEETAPPMSQEHFESLLHTLPGFVVNASHVGDIECRQQMQVFHRQLRGNKLWTLQMLDATGKITSGLLRGNINQFGDFDLCTQVKTMVKVTPDIQMRIRGKYCLAHIETETDVPALKVPVHLAHGRGLWNSHLGNPGHFVPRYAVANWGICIPHLCSGEVVQEMIETNLRPYNTTGVEFHVEVDDNDCTMRQTKKFTKLLKKDKKFGASILCISSLALLIVALLIYEHWSVLKGFVQSRLKSTKSENETETETETEPTAESPTDEENLTADHVDPETEEQPEESNEANEEQADIESTENTSLKFLALEIFKSFSPQRTLTELLSHERLDVRFPIVHLLKLGATFMLYICLKYLMIGHLPITNRDKLVRAVDQPFSIVFRAPMIYTDILLLISGFLSAYQLSAEMEEKSCIHLLKRMTAKVARYLPTVYVVLFFQTWILPHLGAGPLWSNLIGENSRICEQQMWRNVFSAQNAIDFEETCSPMTIQLALEVQLYLLGPLIVWLYYTDSDAGFFVYGAIHAMSVAARFARTNREHLSMTLFHGMNVSKFYRTANILYSSPISRATPYLLGIGAGILHRSQDGELPVSPELIPLGWLLAVLSVLWCFWSPSAGMRSDFIYTSSDAASYASWCPLILGLALFWIIFMFPKSENSVLRFLTSSRPILFLSRIAFPIQLAMYVVVMYNTASVKDSIKYHITSLIDFQEIGTIVVVATILAFIIDIPSQNIRRLVVDRIFMERPHQEAESEPISGAEPSEGEEVPEECPTSDTPEPPDTVWASDPEEEEQKYIARRRSSTTVIENAEDITENEAPKDEEEELEDEEDEEETDIAEEDEVKKRPETPPPVPVVKEEPPKPAFTRRRRPLDD